MLAVKPFSQIDQSTTLRAKGKSREIRGYLVGASRAFCRDGIGEMSNAIGQLGGDTDGNVTGIDVDMRPDRRSIGRPSCRNAEHRRLDTGHDHGRRD